MEWHEVSAWIEARLKSSRLRNDGDLDPIQTAQLRGQIQILKELAALPETKKREEALTGMVGRITRTPQEP